MESGSLTFTGVEISQSADGTIDADQPRYAEKLVEVPISELEPDKKVVVTRTSETIFRGVIEAILWLSVQTRSDLASDVSLSVPCSLCNKGDVRPAQQTGLSRQ